VWLNTYQPILNPSVNLLIHNNQLKQYPNNTFYLKDKTEFSIMFTNSNQCKIACELSFNGKSQSNRLVLLPNSTVKLDRYLDDNKKFVFDIYQVDNNEVVKTIIKDNGTLRIRFFSENVLTFVSSSMPRYTYLNNTFDEMNSRCDLYTQCCSSNTLSTGNSNSRSTIKTNSSQIETGRIAIGSESNQLFDTDYSTYNTVPYGSIDFNLLPVNKEPKPESKNVVFNSRVYCTGCGKRLKSSWAYCPQCGQKN